MRHKVLLLVDDNPLLIDMYRAALEKANFDVIVAYDGETGYQLAKEKRPNGIVLDVLMPGQDGIAILKKLKDDADTKDIKVVVLSVVVDKEMQQKAKDLGVLDYLIKADLSLAETVARISKHFIGE